MKTKIFDAVLESRRWKESVSRLTEGMSRAEVLEFFSSVNPAVHQRRETAEETCVMREEPPKA